MIERTIKLVLRYNKLFIFGTLLLTAILFFRFARVELGASLAGLMPPRTDPEFVFLNKTYDDFGSDYFLLVSITGDNVFSFPTLSKVQKLTSEISEHDSVSRVLSLSTANIIKSKGRELYLHNMSDNIPRTKREIAQFRKDILQNPLYAGSLISDDEKTTMVTIFFEEVSPDRKIREKRLRSAVKEVQAMALAAAGPEEIHIAGFPATTASVYKMIVADLSTFVPLSLVIIILIMLISFRSWRCVLMSIIFISMAVVWTYAFMAMFNVTVFLLTTFLPPIILALGISYLVHVYTEYFKCRALVTDPKIIIGDVIRNIFLAIWLSAITTAVGFISLSVVNVVAIREFSIFLAVGVVSLLLIITFFVPSVMIYIYPARRTSAADRGPGPQSSSSGFSDWIVRYRYAIMIITGPLIAVSVIGAMRLNVNTELLEFFKRSAPIRQATEFMSERLHGVIGISIIIEADKEGGIEDPSFLKSIEALQSFLNQHPAVGKTTSVIDYLKMTNKALHHNNPKYYVLPNSKEEVSQYLLAYSLADPQRMLDRYIDYSHKVAKISLRSSITGSAPMLRFKKLLEEECSRLLPPNSSCKVTSDAMLVGMSSKRISHDILVSFGFAASAISVIMFLLFRSLKMGIIAMIPNLLPLLSILAFMGWMGISFNIGTSLIICVVIGIAVDDTIHFMTRYFHELKRTNHYFIRRYTDIRITADQIRAIGITFNRVKRPIVLTSVIIFFGFLCLGLSQFVPLALFGALTALTMVICLVCDLILLPAIIASVSI